MVSPSPAERVILHVDMDAFYAAVEIRENPSLEGKGVIVGADPRTFHRGVVLTSNYEARRYGIRSGMPSSQALRLCPHAVFVPPRFDLYSRVSREVMGTLRRFADRLEPSGIEEGYLDVTDRTGGSFARAHDLVRELKAAVRREHRLTCSVGVAPSKAVAKIASDFQKPDGLTVVPPERVVEFLAGIPVRKVLGVGPKTAERLRELGLETLADVQAYPKQDLVEALGGFGEYLHDVAFGRDASEVIEPSGLPESISTETTFERDQESFEAIWPALESLARSLHGQLIEEKLAYRTVTLKARYANFETHTRSRSLRVHSADLDPILVLCRLMLKEVLVPGRKIRLVGVRLSNLGSRAPPQATLATWTSLETTTRP